MAALDEIMMGTDAPTPEEEDGWADEGHALWKHVMWMGGSDRLVSLARFSYVGVTNRRVTYSVAGNRSSSSFWVGKGSLGALGRDVQRSSCWRGVPGSPGLRWTVDPAFCLVGHRVLGPFLCTTEPHLQVLMPAVFVPRVVARLMALRPGLADAVVVCGLADGETRYPLALAQSEGVGWLYQPAEKLGRRLLAAGGLAVVPGGWADLVPCSVSASLPVPLLVFGLQRGRLLTKQWVTRQHDPIDRCRYGFREDHLPRRTHLVAYEQLLQLRRDLCRPECWVHQRGTGLVWTGLGGQEFCMHSAGGCPLLCLCDYTQLILPVAYARQALAAVLGATKALLPWGGELCLLATQGHHQPSLRALADHEGVGWAYDRQEEMMN